jgi:glycosyltransferase involved in cell wall biosynthesis
MTRRRLGAGLTKARPATPSGAAPRVVLIHNYPSPYRMPLFEALAGTVDLDVWFCQAHQSERNWKTAPVLHGAKTRALAGFRVGRGIVNWSLPFHLARLDADAIVLEEDLSTISASVMTCLFARARHVPIVLWSEHVPYSPQPHWLDRAKNSLYTRLRRWFLRHAAVVIGMSGKASVQQLRDLGWTGHVWSGPQVVPEENLPVATGTPKSTTPRVLFLGYLRPEKQVPELISAFLSLGCADAELIIAGDGPLRAQVEAAAGPAPNIRIVGYLVGADRSRELEMASALILPSTHEPWGLVVNEALSLGTPVLLSKGAGSAELIREGDNGLTFDPAPGSGALRETLRRFLTDADLRARLQRGAEAESRDDLSSVDRGLAPLRAGLADALGQELGPKASVPGL